MDSIKVITTLYQCSICGETYDDPKKAENCLSKGSPPKAPIGLIYCHEEDGGYLHDDGMVLVFAVVQESRDGHTCHTSCWAARSGFNDNLGDMKICCGGPSAYNGKDWDLSIFYPPNPDWPETQRVIHALKEAGIEPLNIGDLSDG